MADDVDRKQKVAAGLKKLKQFQQRSAKKTTKRKSSESISPPTVQELQEDTPEVCFLEQSSSMALPSKPKETQSLTAHSCQDLSQLASEDQPSNRVLSSAESLRQITLQLNGLMNDTNAALNGDIAALADSSGAPRNDALLRRNQELATSLESLQQDRDQLEFQLQELRGKLTRQQREFEREQQEREDQSRRELGAINDQLQVHIQTIGILVAEKTELQSALSQSQQTAKQKAVETEELQGRLKAARERNTDLERKLNSVSSQSQVQEKSSQEYLREIERLKTEQYKSSKSIEELKQELSELSNKLGKKAKDNEALQQELGDVKKELSLAQLYAQQLGGAQASENVHSQLEELHQEKLDMEKKVNKFKDAMEQIAAEKQQMSSHYQSYVDRLSQQLETSKAMVEKLTQEKVELEKKAVELESRPLPSSVPAPETEELKLRLEQCQRELDSLRSSSEAQANDNQQLSLLVAEREARAEELERQLARIKEDHVESSRLLETIQSDKVAASRALSQNKELKRQLEEMQDVFVKLLAVKEDKVHDLEQLSTKDMYQQSQLADRMRHYQAQCQLTEILQQELSQAQARISALVTQNSDLRKALAERAQMAVDVNEKDSGKVHDLVGSLSASVQQLELERDQLVRQLDEQKGQRETLQHQLIELKQSEDSLLSRESEEVSRESYAKLRAAMQKLEERFKATMDQIADLSDQKQQLEHLVTQLQGETDTIADYIALYQVQRGIMRKRAAEKDDYISQLAKDREDLKAKLSELQCLIVRLLEERQQQHPTQSLPPLPGKALTLASFSSSMAGSPDAGDSGRGEAPTTNGNGGQPEDDETAQKIMHLLTEIETSGAVEGSPVPDTFHPCPVCSGRLLTV
ncbi:golgin subfamily A member 2 isoform X2 [Ixodes scapularis]|uniref:golgin subfamily A member 2 isoform X2 n=1 Tax=Ixodes scapularis TaxID=6945 RepID=UPI001C3809A0|nr:golgin subfamily A member 2 isoform X2 [Ixodes scapularis]